MTVFVVSFRVVFNWYQKTSVSVSSNIVVCIKAHMGIGMILCPGIVVSKKRKESSGNLLVSVLAFICYQNRYHVLQPRHSDKKQAELWRYCYFLGYYRPSLKALLLFLYLSEETFFCIIWKLMYIALFWAVTFNFRVPPSWLKIDFKSIFSLFLDLRPF